MHVPEPLVSNHIFIEANLGKVQPAHKAGNLTAVFNISHPYRPQG
jgi:hypothetical protein